MKKNLFILLFIFFEASKAFSQTSNSFLQAMAAMQQFNYSTAIPLFNKAINEDQSFGKIYLNRGICYFHEQEFEKSAADLQLALSSEKTDALLFLAGIYARNNEYKKAIFHLKELLSKKPELSVKDLSKNPILGKLSESNEWNDFAFNYQASPLSEDIATISFLMNSGNFAEAQSVAQKSLKTFPQSIEIAMLSAKIYALQENYQLAEYELSKALILEPENSQLLIQFANYARQNRNATAAIEKLTEVKNREPELFDVYTLLADLYLSNGKAYEALKETSVYLSYFPSDTSALFLNALALFETQAFTSCLKTMNSLIGKNEIILPEWFKLRGKAYYESGAWQYAAADLSMCLDLSPSDANANYYLGLSNLKLQNNSKACFYLNRAYKYGEKRAFNFIAENCQ